MTCPHCEELEERIAYLESELGLRNSADAALSLKRAFGLSPACAGIVSALYYAKGKPLSTWALLELTSKPGRDDNRECGIIAVQVCRIRALMGKAAVQATYGFGYALAPEALARVAAILEPQQVAA